MNVIKSNRLLDLILITTLFSIFFIAGPVKQLGFFELIPGDLADARLNNYFLENVYQFFIGGSDSLWHLSFFYPYPYIGGFSDNLFGSSPIYLFSRFSGFATDTSFQIWFLFGYIVNFLACLYVLQRLGIGYLGAIIGALIFTFALPTTAHAGHVQLHYRFGIPLTIFFFLQFLEKKSSRSCVISGFWLVWQFYAGIYMGFFTLLTLFFIFISFLCIELVKKKLNLLRILKEFYIPWKIQKTRQKILLLLGLSTILFLLILLFFPYIQVKSLYGFERSWQEISPMLPRPQSYLLSDASTIWSWLAADGDVFKTLPMRHEHSMFLGLIPLLLACVALLNFSNYKKMHFLLLLATVFLFIFLTLSINELSFWYYLHHVPLASAIRAMTRFDQVLLLPIGYFAGLAIEQIRNNSAKSILHIIIVLLLFIEATSVSMYTSPKEAWRNRMIAIEEKATDISDKDIVFFAQDSGNLHANIFSEIDAMWWGLLHNKKIINGYSGWLPPGYYHLHSYKDCTELTSRLVAYNSFSGSTKDPLQYLKQHIALVGFYEHCIEIEMEKLSITKATRPYTAEELSALTLSIEKISLTENEAIVKIAIKNNSALLFSSIPSTSENLRLSWRFLNEKGTPLSGWDTRKDIPYDIVPDGELKAYIHADYPKNSKVSAIQVSIVQEGIFWGHDIGIAPAELKLKFREVTE